MDWGGFWTGVAAGVAVSALTALVVWLWRSVIVPWWLDRGYEGLRLDKQDWNATIPAKDGRFTLLLSLSQRFHNLRGTLDITKTLTDGQVSHSKLDVHGRYWEQFVQFSCTSIKEGRLSFSVFLLKSEQAGQKLRGKYVFRTLNNDKIMSIEVEFSRN